MTETVLKITTWGCGNCGYSQNFDPGDELLWQKHINDDKNLVQRRGYIPLGHCPACFTGLNKQRTIDETSVLDAIVDLSKLSTTTSAGDAELEARKTEVRDEDGNPELEQVDEKFALNAKTGQIEAKPVMAPVMRDLTTKEVDALKLKRDTTLDQLDAMKVQEL